MKNAMLPSHCFSWYGWKGHKGTRSAPPHHRWPHGVQTRSAGLLDRAHCSPFCDTPPPTHPLSCWEWQQCLSSHSEWIAELKIGAGWGWMLGEHRQAEQSWSVWKKWREQSAAGLRVDGATCNFHTLIVLSWCDAINILENYILHASSIKCCALYTHTYSNSGGKPYI